VSLTVSTSEEEAYVKRIAESVNGDMHQLLSTTKASVTSAALLLAVDYMDRFQKANRSATNMRTQIKGYLADAANAKLLYDEERKRSESYAREISELKEKAERDAKSVSAQADNALRTKVSELMAERDSLVSQLERANQTLRMQSTGDRGSEANRLKREQQEHIEQIGKQSQRISQLEALLSQKGEEITRLQGELKTLEDMINEDLSAAKQGYLGSDEDKLLQLETKIVNELREIENANKSALPPLYRADPLVDATYDFEEMPNIEWPTDGF